MIKLPDFSSCVEIKQLLHNMGISKIVMLPNIEFVRQKIVTQIVTVKNTEQLNFAKKIQLEAIPLEFEELSIAGDETLEIKGIKCSIYIKNQDEQYLQDKNSSTYKYHLCNCNTIQSMILQGRKDRYVATSRHDGLFDVNIQSKMVKTKSKPIKLELCEHCKKKLQDKGMYFEPFNLKKFYDKYQPEIRQDFQREEQVIATEKYAPDHNEYAKKYKESVNYCCQICGVNCSKFPHCLHMHHKNGVTTDNKRENIQILCVACHMEQAYHGHMKNDQKFLSDAQTVYSLWEEQGIYFTSSNIINTKYANKSLPLLEQQNIVACPFCTQKIRIPSKKHLLVNCPRCEKKFDIHT